MLAQCDFAEALEDLTRVAAGHASALRRAPGQQPLMLTITSQGNHAYSLKEFVAGVAAACRLAVHGQIDESQFLTSDDLFLLRLMVSSSTAT